MATHILGAYTDWIYASKLDQETYEHIVSAITLINGKQIEEILLVTYQEQLVAGTNYHVLCQMRPYGFPFAIGESDTMECVVFSSLDGLYSCGVISRYDADPSKYHNMSNNVR